MPIPCDKITTKNLEFDTKAKKIMSGSGNIGPKN
jgi:hypothetical protein